MTHEQDRERDRREDARPAQSLDERPLPPGGDVDRTISKHRQTGEGTAPPARDVVDPHPSDEENPYRGKQPHKPSESRDIGPNSYAHDGNPRPRPDNAENGD